MIMCKQDANNPDELTCHALRSSSCPKFIESLAKFEPEQHLIGDVRGLGTKYLLGMCLN